ncbi:MAG: O-antigen ligase family protein [Chloroflexota bacterium]
MMRIITTDQLEPGILSRNFEAVRHGIARNHALVSILTGAFLGGLLIISPWLSLAAALFLIYCLASLVKPVLLCYVTIIATALTSGMERGKLIPFLIPNEPVLLLSAALAFFIVMTRKRLYSSSLHLINTAIAFLITGTMLIPAMTYLLRGTVFTVKDMLNLLAPIQYVILFWLFANIPGNENDRKWILRLMLVCGIIVAAIGLLQAGGITVVNNFLHKWYGSSHELTAVDSGRITSLMSAWNGLGIFLMVNIFISAAFALTRPGDLGTGLIYVSLIICTIALIVTGSYASLAGLALGIFCISIFLRGINYKALLLLSGLAAAGLITYLVFQAFILKRADQQFGYGGIVPATLIDRFRIWHDIYLPAIQKNPIFGVFLSIPQTYSWQYTESQYLSLLFSFGLVGFIAFFLWIAISVRWLFQRMNQSRSLTKPIAAIGISIFLVLSVTGFTNAVFTYSGTADYLWILLALAAYRQEA